MSVGYHDVMSVWINHPVRVEVTKGLFTYHISGIPSTQLKESELRFCSALRNAGFPSPKARLHKIAITIELDVATPGRPTESKPDLSLYESACIVGYLCATRQIAGIDCISCILGTVNLGGEGVHTPALYAAVRTALKNGCHCIYIPESAAAHISNFLLREHFSEPDAQHIYAYKNISDLIHCLSSTGDVMCKRKILPRMSNVFQNESAEYSKEGIPETFLNGPLDAANKKALLIACIGNHPLAVFGPPGQGKTSAFQHIDTLVPPLNPALRAEVEICRSEQGIASETYRLAPIRPHHTINLKDFSGNKTYSVMEQAQGHTLLLDEFIDFKTNILLSLRTIFDAPLSGGPATLIIAAFNPCPCGLYGTEQKCICSPATRNRYIHKIPDSIWDRFHIYCRTKLDDKKSGGVFGISSIKKIYACAQERQEQLELSHWQSGRLSSQELAEVLEKTFSPGARNLVEKRTETFLSLRKHAQAISVSRTIADLEAIPEVRSEHVLEALSLITALPFR